MGLTREEGIKTVYNGPIHVVILGAGASIASTGHNPEPSGKIVPSMENFIEVVALADIIDPLKISSDEKNFEAIYSSLYAQDPDSNVIEEIGATVRSYFQSLELPQTPTIYDYLVLSLRPKDLIATFNWDPFLYVAFCRNHHVGGMPHLSFLHGSVSIGYSPEDRKTGPAGWFSSTSGAEYVPTKLLFPVTQKNYTSDEFISQEWSRLKRWLGKAKRLTIFGYGAPDTDVEAVKLLQEAWGDPTARNLEQVEIIDIQPEDLVRERWDRFIHTHHYDYCTDYFQSVLASFPRRTGERFMHEVLPATPAQALQEPNQVPERFETLKDMWDWFRPLIQAENEQSAA